jgi:hypothetical protein
LLGREHVFLLLIPLNSCKSVILDADIIAAHATPIIPPTRNEINKPGMLMHELFRFHIASQTINIGNNISDYIVLSCKVTCRERWTQDNWSLVHKPKKFILLTLTSDYPTSKRFCESNIRKIITYPVRCLYKDLGWKR